MENDYTKATDNTYGIKDVNYVLHDLSIYTDKDLERFNKEGIYCNRNDRWIGKVESCPDDYIYHQPSVDKSKLISSKNCFLIQDWTSGQVTKLYQECSENIKPLILNIQQE